MAEKIVRHPIGGQGETKENTQHTAKRHRTRTPRKNTGKAHWKKTPIPRCFFAVCFHTGFQHRKHGKKTPSPYLWACQVVARSSCVRFPLRVFLWRHPGSNLDGERQATWKAAFCQLGYRSATPAGFEPARVEPIGLAGRRLSHSAKVSMQGRACGLQCSSAVRSGHAGAPARPRAHCDQMGMSRIGRPRASFPHQWSQLEVRRLGA